MDYLGLFKIIYLVSSTGIRAHNLPIISLLLKPLDHDYGSKLLQ